jgi:integrase
VSWLPQRPIDRNAAITAANPLKAPPMAAGPARSASTMTQSQSCESTAASRPKNGSPPGRPLPGRTTAHARLHNLRHLHATTLLLAGVPVHVIAARLGHADPAVSLRVYSHVLREHAVSVGDIFAQAVKGSR